MAVQNTSTRRRKFV